ncbi:cytochrome ubiquinol oxidase subunit I [Streptomyces sp. NPDC001857]|uniref:cytochrome ubiquinol oxidase subunit I n=1 Tax=unclassified Streptomyces TaxID=2593676 RepID=UPI00331A83DB
MFTLIAAEGAANLPYARHQMALTLGWHIIFACFGIAFPAIVVFTEWLGHRRGDEVLTGLAHTWAKAMGVLFAAGAVSGTLLSFEILLITLIVGTVILVPALVFLYTLFQRPPYAPEPPDR